MDFVPFAAAIALIYALTNLVKMLFAGQTKSVVTQVLSFAVAIGVVLLLAETNYAEGILIGDLALGDLNVASLILLGLSLGGAGNALYDVIPKDTPTLGTGQHPEGH